MLQSSPVCFLDKKLHRWWLISYLAISITFWAVLVGPSCYWYNFFMFKFKFWLETKYLTSYPNCVHCFIKLCISHSSHSVLISTFLCFFFPGLLPGSYSPPPPPPPPTPFYFRLSSAFSCILLFFSNWQFCLGGVWRFWMIVRDFWTSGDPFEIG